MKNVDYAQRKARVNAVFEELRYRKIVATKKDFALLLGIPGYNNLTLAMKGDESYLSGPLMKKVEKVAEEYGISQAAETPVAAEPVRSDFVSIPTSTLVKMIGDLTSTVRSQQETIARLTKSSTGDSQTNVG